MVCTPYRPAEQVAMSTRQTSEAALNAERVRIARERLAWWWRECAHGARLDGVSILEDLENALR